MPLPWPAPGVGACMQGIVRAWSAGGGEVTLGIMRAWSAGGGEVTLGIVRAWSAGGGGVTLGIVRAWSAGGGGGGGVTMGIMRGWCAMGACGMAAVASHHRRPCQVLPGEHEDSRAIHLRELCLRRAVDAPALQELPGADAWCSRRCSCMLSLLLPWPSLPPVALEAAYCQRWAPTCLSCIISSGLNLPPALSIPGRA